MRTIGSSSVVLAASGCSLWIAAACSFAPIVATSIDGAGNRDAVIDGPSSEACQGSGWTQIGSGYYQRTASLVEWGTASADCATVGGHLERITASAENLVAQNQSLAAGNLLWIGLKNVHLDGVYYWTDGSQFGSGDYQNFAAGGIPADSTKPCVAIAGNGEWYLNSCYAPPVYQGFCECP